MLANKIFEGNSLIQNHKKMIQIDQFETINSTRQIEYKNGIVVCMYKLHGAKSKSPAKKNQKNREKRNEILPLHTYSSFLTITLIIEFIKIFGQCHSYMAILSSSRDTKQYIMKSCLSGRENLC